MPPSPPDPDPSLRVVSLSEGGLAARLALGPLALAFHPIAALDRGEAVGYEVVVGSAEAPDGEPGSPAAWSRHGHRAQAGPVEACLVREALTARKALPPGTYLLVEVSPRALLSDELRAAFADAGDLRPIVVAVSDDAEPADIPAVDGALGRLRAAGARFAVDDTGAGSASLEQLVRLRPDLVRVGATFTAGIDRDPAREAVVEALVAVASRIDAQVIAAEVPGAPELHALMRIGVTLAQGPVLGAAPAPAMDPIACEARAVIASGQVPLRSRRTVAEALELLEPLAVGTPTGDVADRFLADPRFDAIVTVDREGRPVGLLDRAAMLRGEPYETTPMTVPSDDPLPEVARRATSRPADDRLRPLVVCDGAGRYLGLVRIERLLEALASSSGGAEEERRG